MKRHGVKKSEAVKMAAASADFKRRTGPDAYGYDGPHPTPVSGRKPNKLGKCPCGSGARFKNCCKPDYDEKLRLFGSIEGFVWSPPKKTPA